MGRRVPFKDSGKHFKTVFLTDEQVSDIVEKYPFTLNTELCDEYGVSKDLICNIGRHYSLKKDKDKEQHHQVQGPEAAWAGRYRKLHCPSLLSENKKQMVKNHLF